MDEKPHTSGVGPRAVGGVRVGMRVAGRRTMLGAVTVHAVETLAVLAPDGAGALSAWWGPLRAFSPLTTLAHGFGAGVALPVPFPLLLLVAAGSLVGLAGLLTSRASRQPVAGGAAAASERFAGRVGAAPSESGARPSPGAASRAPTAVADVPTTAGVTGLRLLGLAITVGLLALALLGDDDPARNPAHRLAFGLLWPAVVPLAALLGGFTRHLSPLRALGGGLLRLVDPEHAGVAPLPATWGVWPAVAGLVVIAWLELVAPAEPALLGLAVIGYLLAQLAATVHYGPAWLAHGESLEVTADLLGRLSPLRRADGGRWRLVDPRPALTAPVPPGTLGVVSVLIGTHLFDFVSDSARWAAVESLREGVMLQAVRGAGLLACITAVAAAGRLAARGRLLLPALIPVVLGYALAHHTPVLLIEGQAALRQLLQPGIRAVADYELLPVTPVAAFVLLGFLGAHLLAVHTAHDLAFARYDPRGARAVQFPLRAVLLASLLGGLALRFPA